MKTLPKFAVGEVVILQSKENPELNGEDTVIEIILDNQISKDRILGCEVTIRLTDGLGYKLERAVISGNCNISGIKVESCWAESALRKKQEPGEMSFRKLMSSLKIEEKV